MTVSVTIEYKGLTNRQAMSQAEADAHPTVMTALKTLADAAIIGIAHGQESTGVDIVWSTLDPDTPGTYRIKTVRTPPGELQYRHWDGEKWYPLCKTAKAAAEIAKTYTGQALKFKHTISWTKA